MALVLLCLAMLCEGIAVTKLVDGDNRVRVVALGLAAYFLSLLPVLR